MTMQQIQERARLRLEWARKSNTVASLESYITADDNVMCRRDFLTVVAERIMDDVKAYDAETERQASILAGKPKKWTVIGGRWEYGPLLTLTECHKTGRDERNLKYLRSYTSREEANVDFIDYVSNEGDGLPQYYFALIEDDTGKVICEVGAKKGCK